MPTLTLLNEWTGKQLSKQAATYSVAEFILEQLRLWGVKRVYGVVGDAIFGLMDAIAKQNAIQFISVKHESVAALMASAEAKYTGKLGVCVAQMGPGLANLINGLGDAYLDGFPVLAITGQAPLNKIGTNYKQYINQQVFVQAITGFTELVVHPDAVMDSLLQAIHTSLASETVSHLSIPSDVFTMPTQNIPLEPPILGQKGSSDPEQLQQVLRMMCLAKRPMMLVGNRARHAGPEIQQLAQVWGCGIAMSYGAVGVIPDVSPFMLGGLGEGGNPFLTGRFKEADVVLAIGTSWWPEGHTPTDARVIQIENRQMGHGIGIPITHSMVGDIALVVEQLAKGLEPYHINSDWIQQIEQCKQSWGAQNEKEGNESNFPLHPSRIVRAIERCTSPDAIIALDEGDSTLWFMRNFRAKRQHVLLSDKWRTMGFGLPAAMAAKCCRPEQQVLCITGDGGLGMVLADLLTAIRYQLQITLIVLNNGILQMERTKMTAKGLLPEGTDLTNPNYIKLAEACGWNSYRVQSENELEHVLRTSLSSPRPVLLDVPTAQVPYPNYS